MGCSEGSVKTHCSRAVHALGRNAESQGDNVMNTKKTTRSGPEDHIPGWTRARRSCARARVPVADRAARQRWPDGGTRAIRQARAGARMGRRGRPGTLGRPRIGSPITACGWPSLVIAGGIYFYNYWTILQQASEIAELDLRTARQRPPVRCITGQGVRELAQSSPGSSRAVRLPVRGGSGMADPRTRNRCRAGRPGTSCQPGEQVLRPPATRTGTAST
jgi:hypothetical protein